MTKIYTNISKVCETVYVNFPLFLTIVTQKKIKMRFTFVPYLSAIDTFCWNQACCDFVSLSLFELNHVESVFTDKKKV